MLEIGLQHKPGVAHHVTQAAVWLSACADGQNTAALSYAALELRFATELLAVQYWAILLDRKPGPDDIRSIESFKRIERRIYELGGHQKQIDGHFEFMRIILSAMKIDMPLRTPNIGKLSKYWHDCSELCHIVWPLSCADVEVRTIALATLGEISRELGDQVRSLGWPVLHDAAFTELRNGYVVGSLTADDVYARLEQTGIWARAEFPDGREAHFVGQAVAPRGRSRE